MRQTTAQQVLGDGQLSEGLGGVGPVIDGVWVPDDPGVRLRNGEFAKVPLLIGANSYEASVLAAFGTDASRLIAALGVDVAALRKLYAGVADGDTAVADQAFGDATFVAGARHVARSAARFDVPVYLYHFDYVLERRRGKVPGAGHGIEIPYVFDSFDQLPSIVRMLTTEQRRRDGGVDASLLDQLRDERRSECWWRRTACRTGRDIRASPTSYCCCGRRSTSRRAFGRRNSIFSNSAGKARRRVSSTCLLSSPSPLLRADIFRSSSRRRSSRRP